ETRDPGFREIARFHAAQSAPPPRVFSFSPPRGEHGELRSRTFFGVFTPPASPPASHCTEGTYVDKVRIEAGHIRGSSLFDELLAGGGGARRLSPWHHDKGAGGLLPRG